MLEPDTYDVWTWSRGQSWRRVLTGAVPDAARIALARPDLYELQPSRPQASTVASFSTVLGFDPNHATADDIAEMADAVHGPIPDTAHRRHAA